MSIQPQYTFLVPTNMPGKPDAYPVEKPSDVIEIARGLGMYPDGDMGTAAGEVYNPNGTLMAMISVGTSQERPLVFQSVVMDPEMGRREIAPNIPGVDDQFVDWNADSVDYPVMCYAMEQTGALEPDTRAQLGRYFETFWYDPSVNTHACELAPSYAMHSYGHFAQETMGDELEEAMSECLREDTMYLNAGRIDRAEQETVKELFFIDRSGFESQAEFEEGVTAALRANPPAFGVESDLMRGEVGPRRLDTASVEGPGL